MNYYGLIGEKLSHSYSKEIHEKLFEIMKIKAGYKLFEIDKKNISSLGTWIKLLKIDGVNVTIPYKEEVISFLDEISEEAREIGAVNTILNKNNKLIGYNTDYYGFKYMLDRKNIDAKNKKVVILGTGGASKAVLKYFKDIEAKEIYLVSRNVKDKKTKDEIKLITYEELKDLKGYVIVNTTPVGMYPKEGNSPVDKSIIENFECVVDLIYNPLKTTFIEMGEALGKITCSGLMMLVAQAVKADELWNDLKIKDDIIEEIFNKLKDSFS